ITWDIVHGSLTQVKVVGSRSGTFSGGGDTFLVTSSPIDADNVTTFNPAGYGTYVAQGSYSWDPVAEFSPSIISSAVKFKVIDGNANYDVTTTASAVINVTGGLSIQTPSEDWNVGDTQRLIEWTTYGDVQYVDIDFYDGLGWVDVTDPATGVASGAGNKSFSVGNWHVYNAVPSVRSNQCKVRVIDHSNGNVSSVSNTFWAFPAINSVTITPTPGDQQGATTDVWRAGTSNQEASWNETSEKITAVDIHVILNGTTDVTLKTNAASTVNGDNTYSLLNLPADLKMSNNAVCRVQDNNPTFASKVYKDSDPFWVLGYITYGASPSAGANWFIGDTNRSVTWTAYGEQMTSIDILADYDGDGTSDEYLTTESTTPGSSDSWVFDDPSGSVDGVGDHVSENAKIILRDANTNNWRQPYTKYNSPAFNIGGTFTNISVNPASGDDEVVAGKAGTTITWDKAGSAISHVRLEYTTNGSDWYILDDGIAPVDLIPNNELYNWTPPAGAISDTCDVRITDPDNDATETPAGQFTIASKCVVGTPDTNSDWIVNDTYTIEWTKYGTFDDVKIYYSAQNGADGTWSEIDAATTKSSHDGDGTHGSYDWYIPATTTTLSGNGRIKVIAKQNESYALATMSVAFEVRGILAIVRPDPITYPGTDSVYKVYNETKGNICPIDWNVTGGITDVVVQYSRTPGTWTTIDTIPVATATNKDWQIPGTDTQIIGAERFVRVYDQGNQNTLAVSSTFEIKGDIILDYPVGAPIGSEEFIIGITETIQWTPKGNFPSGTVVIEGSTQSETFVIINRPSGAHNVQQSYNWNVTTVSQGNLPIGTSVKIKVRDYDDTDVYDESGNITIKGALQVTTPGQVWYVNDTDKSVSWDYDGPIAKVDIYISDSVGVGWIALTPDPDGAGGGVSCPAKYYSVPSVPDAISNTAKIRIRDHKEEMRDLTSDISDPFIVRGRLRFKADKPYQDQVFLVDQQASGVIDWEMDGTIPSIKIDYSTNGAAPFDNPVENSWNTSVPYTWDPVDDNMSTNVKFRIADTRDAANVYVISPRVIIAGTIDLIENDPVYHYNDPIAVGDNFIIKWNKTGADLDLIDIVYSIDNGTDSYPYAITTTPVNADLLQYTWQVDSTDPLHPVAADGGQCKIKIIDHEYAGTVDYSPAFHLIGVMDWDDTGGNGDPAGGAVQVVGENLELEWTTDGDSVTKVRIDYSLDPNEPPTSWVSTPLEASINNTGYYMWYIDPSLANIISNYVRIKISDVYDPNCYLVSGVTVQNEYYFKIRGYLGVTAPDTDSIWIVDATELVTWEKKGPIANVNLYYTYDGGGPIQINTSPIPAGDGTTGFVWTIPGTTSNNATVKVVSTVDSTTYGESETFIIRGGFAWTNPTAAGDVFYVGTQREITWDTFGNIGNVDIKYSTNNGFSYDNFCLDLGNSPADDIQNNETFQWKVPDNISTNVYIKIMDSSDAQAMKITEKIKIADTLYPDNPTGGDRWPVGTQQTIQWHSDGSISNVKLEYTTNANDSTPTWTTIEDTWPADTDKAWNIQSAVPLTTYARIRISDTITDSGTVAVMSSTFKFVGNLNITAPTSANTGANAWVVAEGGEIATNPSDITWSTDGAVNDVNLYYRVSGGNWIDIDGPIANQNTYSWDVADAVSTQVQVMVEDDGDNDTYSISETFQIRADLDISSPVGGEKWRVGETDEITWLRNGSGLTTVYLWYSDNYGGSWKPIGEASNTGSSYWNVADVNLPSGAKEQAKIKITDTQVAPIISTQSPANFKIMANIDVTDPEGGSDIVLAGQGYTIKWNDSTGSFNKNGNLCTNVRIMLALDGDQAVPSYSETIALTTPHDGVHTWNVDVNHVTPNAKIRISDVNDIDSANASSSPFVIRATFVLLDPGVEGENMEIGETYDVVWSKAGNVANVMLQYSPSPLTGGGNLQGDIRNIEGSTNGLVPNEDVKTGDPTQGRFAWTVPDIEDNKDTNLHLRVRDPNDTESYHVSTGFNIIPKFEVTTPSGNENPTLEWKVGQTYEIVWTSSSTQAKTPFVDLYYADFEFGGGVYQTIAEDTENDGSYIWSTANGGVPDVISEQVKIKVVDASDEAADDASDDYFKIISNFTLTNPDGNATYVVDDTINLAWTKKGSVDFVEYAYSTESDNFTNAVVFEPSAATNAQDSGNYTWTIPDAIGYNVRARVASTADNGYDISNADFRIRGKLEFDEDSAPKLGNHVDIGGDFTIKWKSAGTIPKVDIFYDAYGGLGSDGQPISGDEYENVIANDEDNIDEFLWENVPDDATNQAKIKIVDSRDSTSDPDNDNSDVIAISETFNIVGNFDITKPTLNDDWRVATIHDIQWKWGGTIPYVLLTYSTEGLAGTFNPIFTTTNDTNNNGLDDDDGIVVNGTYDPVNLANNVHSYTWTVPDTISPTCIIRIEDPDDDTVYACSDTFLIRGSFEVTLPVGNERWVTNEIRTVAWDTTGTISYVKLEYSNDDFASDVHLITETLSNTGTYNWTIPDGVLKDQSGNYDSANTVKFRVVDNNDDGVYYDSEEFTIDYYKVTWNIVDLITNQPIDNLTVNCTSGWTGSGISSGLTHPTPAGLWKAEWTHPDYGPITHDYLLGWDADKGIWRGDTILFRTMETLIVHIWRAYSEFTYVVDNDHLSITSWLERDGSLVPGALLIDVNIYDGINKIKRKTILVDTDLNKYNYYLDIKDEDEVAGGVKMWIGTRLNNNGTPDDPNDDFEEMRTVNTIINDSAQYKVSDETIPAGAAGFFMQEWSPTNHTSGSTAYDTLQSGKVYMVLTHMAVSTGAIFTTPVSFTVTQELAMDDMTEQVTSVKAKIEATLDKPLSKIEENLSYILVSATTEMKNTINAQTQNINTKLAEQKAIIQKATDNMETMLEASLVSFETKITKSVDDLKAGADRVEAVGDELEATSKKYSWSASVAPNPVISGETVTLSCQGPAGKYPMLDIYSWDNNLITGGIVLTDSITDGLYSYSFVITTSFTPGKAYTYVVSEQTTGGLVSGSGMVESMSLTSLAGLAAAAPGAERAAKKALDAIKAVEAVLISGESINIALTLKNLKESVDALPEVLSKEGPSALMNKTLNDIAEKIKSFAGEEGYDFSDILEEALSDSPTIREVRNKTEAISTVIDILMALFESKFGGMDMPMVETSFQAGSVVFRVIAINPSKFRSQTVNVKQSLPKEVKPNDIIDSGGLDVEFDITNSIYYVHKTNVELKPTEVKVFEIEIDDIWVLPNDKLSDVTNQVDSIITQLEGTEYYTQAKAIADSINARITDIRASQADESVSRQRHIGIYRQNLIVLDEIKEDMERLDKILAIAGAPPAPEMMETPDIEAESPTKAMTWIIIFIIIIFIGLLAGILFFTWHRQSKITREALLDAKKTAFSEPGPEEEKDSENK
ncbi:MAG: hypothetical protein ABH843_00350, partial [Candidatus Omnitrophota bacterium]